MPKSIQEIHEDAKSFIALVDALEQGKMITPEQRLELIRDMNLRIADELRSMQ